MNHEETVVNDDSEEREAIENDETTAEVGKSSTTEESPAATSGGETTARDATDDSTEVPTADPEDVFAELAEAELSEELAVYESREIDVWRDPFDAGTLDDAEGPDEAGTLDPSAEDEAIDVGPVESTDPEDVRSAVLADVKEFFENADSEEFAPLPDESFVEDDWFDFGYLEEYDELERAWVNEPYAYVSVLYDQDGKELRYRVTEPTLDGFEEYVRGDMTRILRDSLLYQDVDEEAERARLFERKAKSIVGDHGATIDGGSLYKILYYLTRDFVDFGKIDPMMRDPAIEDVSCDGTEVPVFVYHREYRDLRSNVSFGESSLDSFTVRLAQKAGKSISVSNPLVDASLPDGSRVQLTLGGEVSTRGSNFTIRKFADVPYTPVDLIQWNTFSVDEMAYFWLAIENNRSLIFAGGTGSGKTTSLNAVGFFIPPNSKVVSIEDTREVTLPHDNWIQSVTRSAITEGGRGGIDMFQLLQSALRQRPEYLLVGEIRTEAKVALTFFQAIGTGHTAYTTVHADSIEGVLSRLQNEPLSIPAQMISNLDVVSIQRQVRQDDRRVRRNQAIVEILPGGDGETVPTRTVFRRDPATDTHFQENDSHVLAEIRDDRGWDQERLERELAARKEVLEYLVDNDVSEYAKVTALVHTFHKDPEFVLERIRAGDVDLESLESAIDDPDPVGVESVEGLEADPEGIDADASDDDVADATELPDEGAETDGGQAGETGGVQ